MLNIVAVLLVMVPLLFGLGQSQTAFAAEDDATIVIHKKKMTVALDPTIQNTGDEMTEFAQFEGLGDIEFNVYDVTTAFYAARQSGQTVDEAKATVQSQTTESSIRRAMTDHKGELSITLPKKSSGKDAVYIISETAKSGVITAENLVIAFPVYQLEKTTTGYRYTDNELSTIHLYPKNVVTTTGAVKLTKTGSAENEKLNGASFILSKPEGGVTQYLSGVKDGLYLWGTDRSAAKVFVSGKSYGIGETDFEETNGELGELLVTGLEEGRYQFTEIAASANAALIAAETTKDFTITTDTTLTAPAEVSVKNDTSKVEKTVPELNGLPVAIGAPIQYKISVNIPLGIADTVQGNGQQINKYTTFNLIDTHDTALSFIESGYQLTDGQTVIDPENYSITPTNEGFVVAIDSDYITQLTPGNQLVFTYHMYLNEKADPTKGFKNQANVENGYTSDPTPPTAEVTTGGKRFVKVDGDVQADKTLADAEFVVRNADNDTAGFLAIDNQTKAVYWVDTYQEATKFTTTENGLVDITGLAGGTYYLEETKAPQDYVKLTNRLSFVVDDSSYGIANELISPEKVVNKHKGILPSTGGNGIIWLVILGLLGISGAGFYFLKGRKPFEV